MSRGRCNQKDITVRPRAGGGGNGYLNSLAVSRACDRFLASRGVQPSGGLRDVIHAACAERPKRAPREERMEAIAREIEEGWGS